MIAHLALISFCHFLTAGAWQVTSTSLSSFILGSGDGPSPPRPVGRVLREVPGKGEPGALLLNHPGGGYSEWRVLCIGVKGEGCTTDAR